MDHNILKNNYETIRQKVRRALPKNQKSPTLMAVTKTQSVEAIREAITLGMRDFGENHCQEAYQKWPSLKREYPDIRLHFIGSIQSNKVSDIVRLFDVIHTIDRPKIAQMVMQEKQIQKREIDCFLQVNIGSEVQKSGVMPEGITTLLQYCCHALHLPIEGLMCIPPNGKTPDPYFQEMQKLAQQHQLAYLSMGMSNDFETALLYGATHIRVGTALFGERVVPFFQ